MPTVQVRNLSEETYEVIRRRAAEAGMSLQRYLCAELTELAARPTKAEILKRIHERLANRDGPGPTMDDILGARDAERR